MHLKEIRQLQSERDWLRTDTHKNNSAESLTTFRAVHNKLKVVISKARRSLLSVELPLNYLSEWLLLPLAKLGHFGPPSRCLESSELWELKSLRYTSRILLPLSAVDLSRLSALSGDVTGSLWGLFHLFDT